MPKTLTVFTPTYNRAHTLRRTYESLCRQTSKEFCWLIVDDGSTDNTKELVAQWIDEKRIDLRYIYQENQGMHGAHNTAYANITTELNTCIDSDDFMPDDAVERIIRFWREKGSDQYAGLIGYDVDLQGKVIGTAFPEGMVSTTLKGFYDRGGKGDKKLVYRTDVVRSCLPYPTFPNERYVGLATLYWQIDEKAPLLTLPAPLACVDYQVDGSSHTMWRQYWFNPQGFLYYRTMELRCTSSLKRRFLVCAHGVAHALRLGKCSALRALQHPLLTFFAVPLGCALYLYTYCKVKHND